MSLHMLKNALSCDYTSVMSNLHFLGCASSTATFSRYRIKGVKALFARINGGM